MSCLGHQAFHQRVGCLSFLIKLVENTEKLNLEENPSLFGLVYNSSEERCAFFNQHWSLRILIFILQDINILRNDIVVNKHSQLRNKVKLSLNNFFFLVFGLELVVVGVVELLSKLIKFSTLLLSLLLVFLDLSFLLCLNGEHFTFTVFVKHFVHDVCELKCVSQELEIMLLMIKHFDGILRNRGKVVLENVTLKDLGISLVSFIV